MPEKRASSPEPTTAGPVTEEVLRAEMRPLGLGFHVLAGSATFVGLAVALELVPLKWAMPAVATYLAAWVVVFVVRYRRQERREAAQPPPSSGEPGGPPSHVQ